MFSARIFRLLMTVGALALLTGGGSSVSAASPIGHLSALVLDEAGEPISNVLLSLLSRSADDSLPTLTRTDEQGRVLVSDLMAGIYQISIKSSQYRSPVSRLVEILPDRTAVVTLILQEFFTLPPAGENVGVKALFRLPNERRLIFRGLPGMDGLGDRPERRLFEDAVVEIYTNGGLGGDYFVFPGDSWGGTATNFAAVVDRFGTSEHIVAGQFNSGEDSLWRVKNVFKYDVGDQHSLRVFMGYGRVSFDQPSLALMNNPDFLASAEDFTTATGTSHLLNVGFADTLQFGPALTLTWGVELDRVRGGITGQFVSPNAEVRFRPLERTDLRLAMTSRRPTLGNTVTLPNGDSITLSSPLSVASFGGQSFRGTSRHLIGSLTQELAPGTAIEVALFRNNPFGPSIPLVALSEMTPGAEVLRLPDGRAESRGYRLTFSRRLNSLVATEVSYIRGRAPSFDGSEVGPIELGSFSQFISRQSFQGISGQIEAFVPVSGTRVTALVKLVSAGNPLTTLDPLSDVRETGNEGINLFVRQVIPLPEDLLSFLGLDFLTPQSVEALIDVRNMLNENLGVIHTSTDRAVLVQNPRSIRGGLSFRF